VFGLDDGGGQVDSPDFATNRSPQALRSMSQRNASFRSARRGDADSDAASLASSNADTDTDDGSSSVAALDPLEHEWMMCASDGEWERLVAMLTGEPSLVLRKDFVTGFNLLHWAAKRGDPELLALAVNFAKRRGVPVDINTRSSCGYTPLHLAVGRQDAAVANLLCQADADKMVRNTENETPLDLADGNDDVSTAMAKRVLVVVVGLDVVVVVVVVFFFYCRLGVVWVSG
jgi:hypothetical protein